jgi:hypothetical protein
VSGFSKLLRYVEFEESCVFGEIMWNLDFLVVSCFIEIIVTSACVMICNALFQLVINTLSCALTLNFIVVSLLFYGTPDGLPFRGNTINHFSRN